MDAKVPMAGYGADGADMALRPDGHAVLARYTAGNLKAGELLLRLAGDAARRDDAEFITGEHIRAAARIVARTVMGDGSLQGPDLRPEPEPTSNARVMWAANLAEMTGGATADPLLRAPAPWRAALSKPSSRRQGRQPWTRGRLMSVAAIMVAAGLCAALIAANRSSPPPPLVSRDAPATSAPAVDKRPVTAAAPGPSAEPGAALAAALPLPPPPVEPRRHSLIHGGREIVSRRHERHADPDHAGTLKDVIAAIRAHTADPAAEDPPPPE